MHPFRTPMRLPLRARTVGISGPTSRLPNKFRLALAVLIAAPTTLTTIAAAETETNWVGDFDSWDQDANWDNSAPDAGVSAAIDNGGTASVASPDSQAADIQVRDGGLRVGTGGSLTTPDDTRRSVFDGPTNASLDVNGQLSTGNNPLTVARDGNGRLVVRNGGHLSSGDDSRVADGGGTATVFLDGTDSRWTVAGDLAIGDAGQGNAGLRLSNGGRLEAERIEADAEETQIIIGHSATSPVGLIAAEEIVGGTAGGSTELTFAHQADDYYFTDDGTADGEATAINGNVEVVAAGQGRTTLAGENGYDQGTRIETATLSVRSDANLGDATGTLLINDGTLETTGSFTSRRATEIGAIGGTFHVQDGTTLTHEGTISGTGRLRKAGAGTLVLSGDNDYARTFNAEQQTWITDGILSVAEDGHLGGAAGGLELDGGTLRTTGTFTTARTTTLASAASALEVADGTTLTHEGMLSGTGGLSKTGGGTLALSGSNDYTGGTRIERGTVAVSADDQLGADSGGLRLDGGALRATRSFTTARSTELGTDDGGIHVDANAALDHEGAISGNGRLIKTGDGELTLAGTNAFTGGISIEAGSLAVSEDTGLGDANGDLRLDGGTLRTTGTFATDRATTLTAAGGGIQVADDTTLTHDGALSGAGGLTKTGDGTLTLGGANDYTGGTSIEGGTLAVSADDRLGADSGGLRLDGGALQATGSFSTARSTTLDTAGGDIRVNESEALVHEGIISGDGPLTKAGDGDLVLAGTNDHTGDTTLAAGELTLRNGSALADSGRITINGGTLNVDDAETVGALSGDAGTINLVDDLTAGDAASTTFAGTILGDGSLRKAGAGTLTLSGANDYTGGTSIEDGTLAVSADDRLGADSGGLRLDGGALQATDSFTTARSTTLGTDGGIRVDESAAMVHEGAISGSGQLTKTGNGHLILAGTNDHTGGTTLSAGELTLRNGNALADSGSLTINGGTLNVDDAETVGTLSGDAGTINLADDLTAGDAADTNFAGAIVGDGGLRKTGTGTLTLSGENRHTGGTSIEAGAIVLRGGDALPDSGAVTLDGGRLGIATAETIGALTGAEGTTIDLDADLTAGDQNDTTVASTITGAGGLTKAGSGRVILSGTNDFTGGTSLSAGELVLRDGNALADGGGVTIDGGRLVIADAETIGTLEGASGTIRLESDLTAGGAGDTAFAGTIQGTGGLRKTGEGSLTLSGQNDYAGGTGIEAGTLAVKGGNAIADDGSVVIDGGTFAVRDAETVGMLTGTSESTVQLDADLTVHSAGNASYMGRMTGSGGFVKKGTGHLLLAGDSDHTGPTRVDAGRLTVNGSIEGSAVAVAGGATLGGDGTVGATTIENDGTLAPGNSIGTLHVDGDITLASASTYAVETDADGNSDRTEASGTATIDGGTVEVLAAGGDYQADTDYSILQADAGVTGTFDDTRTNIAFLDPSLDYDDNEVTLTLTRNDLDYASVAQTPNQRAVATALTDAAPGGGDEAASLTASIDTLDTAGARAAYDNLSGMQHTHASGAARQQNQRFMSLIRDRLGPGASAGATRGRAPVQIAFSGEDWGRMLAAGAASAPEAGARGDDGRGLWVRALGGNGEVDGTANATGADYTSAGLAIGADTRLDNGLIAGLAAGYGRTDSDTGTGDLDTDSYQIAGYAQWRKDGTYVDSRIGLGRHRTDAARSIVATDAVSTATADYDADQFTWSFEGGHAWREWNNATITPFAGVDFNRNERRRFRERGAGAANLNVEEETWTSLRTRLGTRMTTEFETGGGTTLEPRFELAWVREHADREAAITAHFDAAPASSFTVEGPELDRDRAAIGAGITARLDDTSRLDLEYRGDFADSDRHHGIALSWRTTW